MEATKTTSRQLESLLEQVSHQYTIEFTISDRMLGTLSYLALVPKLHTGVSRMIWQSSCFFSNQLIRPENSQQAFDRICSIFGIESSDNDKVKKLRQISAEDLIKESPAAILGLRPVWDGITIDNDPRSAIYGADIWDKELKALVMGNCANEV